MTSLGKITVMPQNLTRLTLMELYGKLSDARLVLRRLAEGLSAHPDVQDAVGQLAMGGKQLKRLNELAAKDPELARLLLGSAMLALANMVSMEAARDELALRGAVDN